VWTKGKVSVGILPNSLEGHTSNAVTRQRQKISRFNPAQPQMAGRTFAIASILSVLNDIAASEIRGSRISVIATHFDIHRPCITADNFRRIPIVRIIDAIKYRASI
jgi:hypothetical protein